MSDLPPSLSPSPTTFDYASQTPAPHLAADSSGLRRYSVYGLDELSSRSVRVRVDAYGLPNLYAQLKRAQVMAEFIADEPGDHDEPPPIEHWHADAGEHAPEEFAKQVRRMTSTSHGRYAPIPAIRVRAGDERKTASPTARIVLRLPEGYLEASGRFPNSWGAYKHLFGWCLFTGIVDVLLGGTAVGVLLFLSRGGGAILLIPAVVITLTMIVPGIAFIVLGSLSRTIRHPWIPITCLVVAGLFCAFVALSIVGPAITGQIDGVTIAWTVGMGSIHAAVVAQCIKALRS